MQKQDTATTRTVNLNEKVVMPTQRELLKSREYGLRILPLSNFAVFVKKIASTQRHNWTTGLDVDKQTIQEICGDFGNYEFIVNFQYRRGTDFNRAEMEYFEKVQQIPALNHLCMNEKSSNQTAQEFSEQLDGWKSRNGRKEIVPVLEADTNEMVSKVAVMKRKRVKRCAVIFRSFISEEDRANLSRVLFQLKQAGIYSFVIGVNPKKWKPTNVSMILPPLQFEANAISSWIAWGGGKSPMEFLCSDWVYKEVAQAEEGLSEYDENTKRHDFLDGNTSTLFNTALSQIDTVNQAGMMARTFISLPEVQFERLFN